MLGLDSLHRRLLVAASVVLTGFLGLTGWALDQAFRGSAESAVRERLQAHIYALLAAADLDAGGALEIPEELPEARFSAPGSGLYAQVVGQETAFQWSSRSMLGMDIPFQVGLQPGLFHFRTVDSAESPLFALSFGVVWEDEHAREHAYTFSVAESTATYWREIRGFRRALWGWLGGLAVILLLLQGSILRWGLRPLRQIPQDLAAIEAGSKDRLEGAYPRELRGLTDALNALLEHDRERLERYRNALADLAHSLKTPLAVLQGLRGCEADQETVREQVRRMNQIVDYQLQRAATSGQVALSSAQPLRPVVDRILASLTKVYAEKMVQVTCDISAQASFYGDRGDLVELLGNLLDNAHKWCRSRVAISGRPLTGQRKASRDSHGGVEMRIEDDGPGIAPERRREVLRRGVRADARTAGQGIGLAVVRDIVEAYRGELDMGESPMGGACVRVRLPGSGGTLA